MNDVDQINLAKLMEDKAFRHFMQGVLNGCCLNTSGFDPDSHVTANNLGRKSIGLSIVNKLQAASPTKYLKMIEDKFNG